jgi:hypothetical protein
VRSGSLVRFRRKAARSWLVPVGVLGGAAAFLFLYKQLLGGIPLVTKIYHRERADGLDGRIGAFLDWWEQNGPFPIMVGVDGGLRTPEKQEELFARGVTKAKTIETTPHGHAAAVDLWPVNELGRPQFKVGVFNLKTRMWEDRSDIGKPLDPEHLQRYQQIGQLAKAQGFEWGGDWFSFKDLPHIEINGWASLPLVPRGTAIV